MSAIVLVAIITGGASFALMWPHGSFAAIAVMPFAASFAVFAVSLTWGRRAPVSIDHPLVVDSSDHADLMVTALRSMTEAAARYTEPSDSDKWCNTQRQAPARRFG